MAIPEPHNHPRRRTSCTSATKPHRSLRAGHRSDSMRLRASVTARSFSVSFLASLRCPVLFRRPPIDLVATSRFSSLPNRRPQHEVRGRGPTGLGPRDGHQRQRAHARRDRPRTSSVTSGTRSRCQGHRRTGRGLAELKDGRPKAPRKPPSCRGLPTACRDRRPLSRGCHEAQGDRPQRADSDGRHGVRALKPDPDKRPTPLEGPLSGPDQLERGA